MPSGRASRIVVTMPDTKTTRETRTSLMTTPVAPPDLFDLRAVLHAAAVMEAGCGEGSAQLRDAASVARRWATGRLPVASIAPGPASPTADELRRVAAHLRGKKAGPTSGWQAAGAILDQDADAIERGAREAAGRAMVDVPGVAAMLGAIAGATLLDMVSSNLDRELSQVFHERTTYVAVAPSGRTVATVTVERGSK